MTNPRPEPNDAVFIDGSIITQDPSSPRAGALWVRDGVVAAVGDATSVLAAADNTAPIVSLGERTVLPGLIDAHCHLTWLGYLLGGADCTPAVAPTVEAILENLAAQEAGGEGWVTGSGYAEYKLDEQRHPTRWELDRVVPDRPAVLFHTSLHVCVVNSAGLQELGYSAGSQDPPGGRFGRDADGRLDGRLLEAPTFALMEANMSRHMSAAGVEGGAALIERAARHFASLGITSCAEASTDATSFAALLEADRGGRLPIRVTGLFTYSGATGLLADGRPAGVESDFLRIGGVKIWADGGMSSRTAAVDEPYLDPPGEMGMLIYDEETLTSMIGRCEEAGFQVAIHAQGERAIRTVLAAFARASAPGNPLRHRIEHGGAFTPELRDIAATQGIHVVSQPGFLSQLGEGFLAAFGPERSRYLYPFASLQRAGIVVAGSSDAPVIDASPFFAMRDAIERRTQAGRAIAADETITAAQALDLYTRHAAFVGGQEDRIGTLEVGKQADFVVVDRSPLDIPAASIAETTVHRTVVAGRVVFDDGSIGG